MSKNLNEQGVHEQEEPNAPETTSKRLKFIGCVPFATISAIIGVIAAISQVGGFTILDVYKALQPGIRPARSNEILILVTQFQLAENIPSAEPHIQIRDKIEAETKKLGLTNVRTEVLSDEHFLEEIQSAKNFGNIYNASIVISGVESSTLLKVDFLSLSPRTREWEKVQIRETNNVYISAANDPDKYIQFINEDLPGHLAFLALFAIGKAQASDEEYESAILLVRKALESLPKDTDTSYRVSAYYTLGWLFWELERYTKSFEFYNKLITIALETTAQAYNGRGLAHAAMGNVDNAISDYNKAIQLEPNYFSPYNNRGNVAFQLKDYPKALDDYDMAIRLNKDAAAPHRNRGLALFQQGKCKPAIMSYKTALQIDPYFFEVHNDLRRATRALYRSLNGCKITFWDWGKLVVALLLLSLIYTGLSIYFVRALCVRAISIQEYIDIFLQQTNGEVRLLYLENDTGVTHLTIHGIDPAIKLNLTFCGKQTNRITIVDVDDEKKLCQRCLWIMDNTKSLQSIRKTSGSDP